MSSIDVTVDLVRAITTSLEVHGNDDWESYSAVIDPQDNDFLGGFWNGRVSLLGR